VQTIDSEVKVNMAFNYTYVFLHEFIMKLINMLDMSICIIYSLADKSVMLGFETRILCLDLVGEGFGLGLVHVVSVSSFVVLCFKAFRDLPQSVTN